MNNTDMILLKYCSDKNVRFNNNNNSSNDHGKNRSTNEYNDNTTVITVARMIIFKKS